ncbi:carboxypeptidase regulatory-like domain-containing protein [Terracidiphilus sp.]|jgi:hypothetical protein|uniref:TonB-dependent receptor n=1 Tax=Terracidiphilus sp. TaxID=1964191 RepID=UPI003C1D6B92
MRFIKLQGAALALSLLTFAGMAMVVPAPVAHAQTAVTGAISGVVADSSGAVVPNAMVTVINAGTNAKLVVTTNAEGRYTAPQLVPGTYKVSATSAGLQSETTEITVLLGATLPADIKVTPTADKTIIEVSATTLPLVDTQNVALATTFNSEQIESLPTPGGDVTTIAFTAPGVVVNSGGTYGNFSSEGLPGISNLFVMNGFDNQDPFLNLNNSGSSNLTLGQGELAEATVVQNGYNSQYGRAAGATVNYTTKSGTNKFHGMADYNWNGTLLNANGWFNNYNDAPRPHAVSNEWAANVGGPIIKDRLFFFADYEGLRYVLPGASGLVNYPSTQFQAATLANIPASDVPLYNQAFAAYQGAPSYSAAQPVDLTTNAGGCGNVTGTPAPGGGTFGVNTPCMTQAFAETNNINEEWLFTGRADWNISDKHRIYGRYKMDRGSQPTSTSFINPEFSTISIQPEYEGQFNDSYVFSPTKTNVFVAAANWYTAYFGPQNVAAAQAVFPWSFTPDAGLDGSGTSASLGLAGLGVPDAFPQGRNVTQYQLEDDFSWIHGKNTIKFGANFRRDLITDFDAQELTDFPFVEAVTLGTFYSGAISPGAGEYVQNYAADTTAHLALYNLGVYVQDEWQASPKLKLTIGARVDRTGNPLCHQSCFSSYVGNFPASAASLTQPYNFADGGSIRAQNANAFPGVQAINFQPRFGFNYSIDGRTEIRGGVGWFSDLYPAAFIDGIIQNFPNVNQVAVLSGNLNNTAPSGVTANSAAANTATQAGFTSGQNVTQINNALVNQGILTFTPPTINAYIPGTFKSPEYLEYNLQLQRQIGRQDAVIVTYAGNYGFDEVLQNGDLNAATGYYNALGDDQWDAGVFPTLNGVPNTPADPSFSRVTAYTNNAHSNYNAAMVTWKHIGHGITSQMNYTYSHALDMISNGGTGEVFNGGSIVGQLTPTLGSGNLNYSNSDYDVRNNLSADLVYTESHIKGHKYLDSVAGGWVIGGKTYYHSGLPFSITNAVLGNAGYTNVSTTFMVDANVPRRQLTNTSISNPKGCLPALGAAVQTSCLDMTQFGDPSTQADFGNLRRNALFGPHFADTDINLSKKFVNLERFSFSLGADAYNLFNHANFGAPGGSSGVSSLGVVSSTLSPPTSPYGSFQGAAVTQRLLVVHGKFVF